MIFFASIDQGGQDSFILQLVKTPLFIIVIFPFLDTDAPLNLGSFSELSNISL